MKTLTLLSLLALSTKSFCFIQKSSLYKIVEHKGDVTFTEKNITIPPNELWIFSPGSKVSVPANGKITVQGKLRISGAEGHLVQFYSKGAPWLGFKFLGSRETTDVRLKVSRKIQTGLSFIRYAELKNIGSTTDDKAIAFDLINHEGILVSHSKVSSGTNYSIASLFNSELYLNKTAISGSFSYPLIKATDSVLQTNENSYPAENINGTVFSLTNSAGMISNSTIKSKKFILESHRSSVMLNNCNFRSSKSAVFQNQGVLSVATSKLLSPKKSCSISQSHDSVILDRDSQDFCVKVWPSMERFPDEEPHPLVETIEQLINSKIRVSNKNQSLSRYTATRNKILGNKKFWALFSGNKKGIRPQEFVYHSDKFYIDQWIMQHLPSHHKDESPLHRYLNFQKSYALGEVSSEFKVPQKKSLISKMLSQIKVSAGGNSLLGHCVLKEKKWLQDFTDFDLELLGSDHRTINPVISEFCSDFDLNYFGNYKYYHKKLLEFYASSHPHFL